MTRDTFTYWNYKKLSHYSNEFITEFPTFIAKEKPLSIATIMLALRRGV